MALIEGLIGAGASILGGFLGSKSEKDAAEEGIALQRESRDISLRLMEPSLVAGNQALQLLGSMFGITVPGFESGGGLGGSTYLRNGGIPDRPSSGDVILAYREYVGREPTREEIKYYTDRRGRGDQLYANIIHPRLSKKQEGKPAPSAPGLTLEDLIANNPIIKFNREQGEDAIARGAAARGLNQSGGTLKDLSRFNQDLSATGAERFVLGPLMEMAGFGQRAATVGTGSVLNTGANMANLLAGAGNARSSAYSNAGNEIGNLLGSTDALTNWFNRKKS